MPLAGAADARWLGAKVRPCSFVLGIDGAVPDGLTHPGSGPNRGCARLVPRLYMALKPVIPGPMRQYPFLAAVFV